VQQRIKPQSNQPRIPIRSAYNSLPNATSIRVELYLIQLTLQLLIAIGSSGEAVGQVGNGAFVLERLVFERAYERFEM
jgi:hypothetical protein